MIRRPALRVGLDVDEVLADLLGAWLARINRDRGTNWTPDDLTKWECWTDLGLTADEFFSYLDPTIYHEVEPFPGAAEFTAALRADGHTITFVSSCGPKNEHEPMKRDWLLRHRIAEPGEKFIATQFKGNAPVDVLVDDHVKNLLPFTGHRILFTRPHNRLTEWLGKRVKNYDELLLTLRY